jgi:hypothetical protein
MILPEPAVVEVENTTAVSAAVAPLGAVTEAGRAATAQQELPIPAVAEVVAAPAVVQAAVALGDQAWS